MNLLCDIKLVGEYRKLQRNTQEKKDGSRSGLWQEICQEEFEEAEVVVLVISFGGSQAVSSR